MKRALLAMALVMISGAAFAEAGQPTKNGDRCWVLTDSRGFGYWDQCASWHKTEEANRKVGIRGRYARAQHQLELHDFDGAGGGGGR
jgi:hypothetical protein